MSVTQVVSFSTLLTRVGIMNKILYHGIRNLFSFIHAVCAYDELLMDKIPIHIAHDDQYTLRLGVIRDIDQRFKG